MMIPTRRGFLGGLIAAPAIVKFQSIMPVKTLPLALTKFQPELLQDLPITPEIIAQEAARTLHHNLEVKVSSVVGADIQLDGKPLRGVLQQLHIDYAIDGADTKLGLEAYIKRILSPCMTCLAGALEKSQYRRLKPKKLTFNNLQLPSLGGAESAIGFYQGVVVRYTKAYDVQSDQMLGRFDVLTKTDDLTANLAPVPRLATPKGYLP